MPNLSASVTCPPSRETSVAGCSSPLTSLAAAMDMNTCCAYFCTGMSVFGVVGLLFMYGILQSGGEWYLGVSEEDAPAAASACLVAAGIYLLYLIYCGLKLGKTSASSSGKERLTDDD